MVTHRCTSQLSRSIKCDQAINNLAVTDENKAKIVEAGALPRYVELLSPERDESEQIQAAHGLWTLAFKCKTSIVEEHGCLEGHYFIIVKFAYSQLLVVITNSFFFCRRLFRGRERVYLPYQ